MTNFSSRERLRETRNSKLRSPKSRRKSCAPCALAKCKCDLQQPCSCCIAKKRECMFTETKSVTAVRVAPADVSETERSITPSTSSDIIFTPDDFIPPNLKPCAPQKQIDSRYPPDVSPSLCLAPPPDLTVSNHHWLGDTGQPVDRFSSSCLQDMFFDWNVPPGCGPLDFSYTFSPIYASAETTRFGVISDLAHILTPSAYLEPTNTQRSVGELKRYRASLISVLLRFILTVSRSQLTSLSSYFPASSPFCTPRGRKTENLLFF